MPTGIPEPFRRSAAPRIAAGSGGVESRFSWRPVAVGAAAGAGLLALFVVPAGSAVAITVVLLVALTTALAVGGVAAFRAARHKRGGAQAGERRAVIFPVARAAAGSASEGRPGGNETGPGAPLPSMPFLPSTPPTPERTAGQQSPIPPEVARMVPPDPPSRSAGRGEPDEPVFPPAVAAAARQVAEAALRRVAAPAVAVLVVQGRRLRAAATAGDWGEARRQQREAAQREGAPSMTALGTPAEDDAPPEFPLDDYMPVLLAEYVHAVPVERWRELSDAPPYLLPLAALAAGGAGAAVSLRHRRGLAGLCVLARRATGGRYSDAELASLERFAGECAPVLAAALERGAR